MITEKYKLSVIIPCWNCSKVIGDMLDSILSQSYDDWRVFCVDDQSTDDTYQIIKNYSKRDGRINAVVRNRTPKGAQTCRNIGLELSEGAEYIIWFDSDDIIAPYCFEQRVAFMEKRKDLDFGVFYAKSFYNNVWEREGIKLYGFPYLGTQDLCRFIRRDLPFVGWTNIYRRSSLIKYNMIWDVQLLSLQDSDFNIQSLIKGLRYDYCKEGKIDYFWRQYNSVSNISKKISSVAHQESHLYFLSKLFASLTPELIKKYKLDLDSYILFFVDKFISDRLFISKIRKMQFLSNRRWFSYRILLYSMVGLSYKKVLFPVVTKYRHFYDKKMEVYCNKLLDSLIV